VNASPKARMEALKSTVTIECVDARRAERGLYIAVVAAVLRTDCNGGTAPFCLVSVVAAAST
jgi:hypothetical protein